ncbi:MAG TPA: hypothetical protein VK968_03985, partial [Roseimicrobium sp.]|nr:hypothetical protein [Roseimicrobium sp.]
MKRGIPIAILLPILLLVCRVAAAQPAYEKREVEGLTLNIRQELLKEDPAMMERAVEMLRQQLADIVKGVPEKAVIHLRKVPLWFSPEYPGVQPRAEYHPAAEWLRANKRDPAMAKGIEFTNIRIFEKEWKRMPVFVLHELTHAFHHQVLGYGHAGIFYAFKNAQGKHIYDSVDRWSGPDQPIVKARAYAMTNEMEYFAETTEAYFGRNDFFPFTRSELEQHDPEIF